ncbi:MAG: acetate/propionate family kinase [Acidobacteria bacterium]|nr:acetate/propionate family kinase [Acidobacteriota bacterium]MCA1609805.1 acetate/propionate family kinase [Acidobacteriota bacterium]
MPKQRAPGFLEAVGHRIVHGGDRFREPALFDAALERELAALTEIAPLHNPPALEVLKAARTALPDIPHVAVFDTAFFAELPPRAQTYPLPWEWRAEWGIRRFGFHGLSHEYAALRASELTDGRAAGPFRVVSCHLGQGCSAAAVSGRRPVATTMGFTPLEGLMMGTRSGSVDPGILPHVLRVAGWSAEQLEDALNRKSGLLGVSGVSSDFRKVEDAAGSGDPRARLALDLYADRVRDAIASLAATLGGLDVLIFTGGVGEHSASLRSAACANLAFMGVTLDADRNDAGSPEERNLAATTAPVEIFAIHAREEWMIAGKVRFLLR